MSTHTASEHDGPGPTTTPPHREAVHLERLPPQDTDAEQCVLGGMLLSKDAIGEIVESGLKSTDFYGPQHQLVFSAVMDLYGRGEPADPITVAAELTRTGGIGRVGGPAYLHTLVHAVPTAANAAYYAEIVTDRAKLRRLVEAGTRITQMGYLAEGDTDDILDRASAEIQAVTTDATGGGLERVRWLDEMLEDYLRSMDEPRPSCLPLPYTDLERILRAEPGDLIVVAARPAVGKSVVLLDIARHVSIRHRRTAMVSSMEMNRPQLMERIIAAEARVGLQQVKARQYDEDDRRRVEQAAEQIAGAPLVVDDGPAATLHQLRSRLRWLNGRGRLPAVLLVDYIQIMKAAEKRGQSRTAEVDGLSRGLKELASEFQTTVIAAAQLNREVERRADRTPTLADLRESGSIEADANAVILLHRPDAYAKDDPRAGELDLIVAKNRQGPTSTVTVAFQGHYARAKDMAPHP
ncbi:replicative DNA helicase [Streptomyces sp. NPDC048636]|uniref:replicative DNA helicase n=1 Tax=Streptomyces sp. NPDC048636 TaxID=3155762 RepID=UPI0034191CE5